VRDANGQKMSKSLGNGIDPLEIIDKYGADALRFMLISGTSPGNDMRFQTEKIEGARNFANKLWNASRFVLMNLTTDDFTLPDTLDLEDRWILSRLNTLIRDVTDNIEKYEVGLAADKIYAFLWDTYCDWYIEVCKIRLQGDDTVASLRAQRVLGHVLETTLRLLHPFMPFITESLWQSLPHTGPSIMVAPWPKADPALSFPEAEAGMSQIMAAIRAVRNLRSEMNVPPSRKAALVIVTDAPGLFAGSEGYLQRLAWASDVSVVAEKPANAAQMASCVTPTAQIFIPLGDLVDTEKEIARLTKELENAETQIARITAKLGNSEFTAKAPEKVVAAERAKLESFRAVSARVAASLSALRG
jgi:valyl-tRNA synthetase